MTVDNTSPRAEAGGNQPMSEWSGGSARSREASGGDTELGARQRRNQARTRNAPRGRLVPTVVVVACISIVGVLIAETGIPGGHSYPTPAPQVVICGCGGGGGSYSATYAITSLNAIGSTSVNALGSGTWSNNQNLFWGTFSDGQVWVIPSGYAGVGCGVSANSFPCVMSNCALSSCSQNSPYGLGANNVSASASTTDVYAGPTQLMLVEPTMGWYLAHSGSNGGAAWFSLECGGYTGSYLLQATVTLGYSLTVDDLSTNSVVGQVSGSFVSSSGWCNENGYSNPSYANSPYNLPSETETLTMSGLGVSMTDGQKYEYIVGATCSVLVSNSEFVSSTEVGPQAGASCFASYPGQGTQYVTLNSVTVTTS